MNLTPSASEVSSVQQFTRTDKTFINTQTDIYMIYKMTVPADN